MKVVLFCGGAGMRLRGYSDDVPKPMVTIGSRPVLWHVMKYYAHFGHKDFILCLGYKANASRTTFWTTMNPSPTISYCRRAAGNSTSRNAILTIGRSHSSTRDCVPLLRIDCAWSSRILNGEEMFLANYSDGLTDFCLPQMIQEFSRRDSYASFLSVQPRSSSLDTVHMGDDGSVRAIKCMKDSNIWVNGGYFVLRKEIFRYIKPGEELVYEPFQRLISEGKIWSHRYEGFWQCMDTFRDKQILDELEAAGTAPWRVWKNGHTAPGVVA